jgi:aryl-alcohol dehydrogenase-like predicted oxidoreductase
MTEAYPEHHDILREQKMGIGTWAWGDRLYWGYGNGYDDADLFEAFQICLNAGIQLFDTAEVYGQGRAETLLGEFIRESGRPVMTATKFMPYPWRLTKRSLLKALRASLKRLNLESVDLYQIHFPLPPLTIESWMGAMAEAVQAGMTRAVGISNCNREQMQRAYETLVRQGARLASNQVEYNLLNRSVEKSGLLALCKDMGVTLVAYSPIAMGLLSGKYSADNPPQGIRGGKYNRAYLKKIEPLILQLRRIGAARAGKTPAQVALNWVICKGALPIPGVKNREQALENIDCLNWRLNEEEIVELDEASDQVERQN